MSVAGLRYAVKVGDRWEIHSPMIASHSDGKRVIVLAEDFFCAANWREAHRRIIQRWEGARPTLQKIATKNAAYRRLLGESPSLELRLPFHSRCERPVKVNETFFRQLIRAGIDIFEQVYRTEWDDFASGHTVFEFHNCRG